MSSESNLGLIREWVETIWNNDKIVEVWAVADTAAVLQQLGVKLLPPDEAGV